MNQSFDNVTRVWDHGSSRLDSGAITYNFSSNSTGNQTEPGGVDLKRAIPLGLVLGAFIVFAIVGNILVILAVVCNRHLRTPTNCFIINLAIADLLLGTMVLPVSATLEILDYWVFGRIFCDIWAALDVLCCTASIMSLCVISIDRYIGVSYPLQYPGIVTEKRALWAMFGVWVLSIVISIGPLFGWKQPPLSDDTACPITEEPFYALFSSLGSFYIPLVVILVITPHEQARDKAALDWTEADTINQGSFNVHLRAPETFFKVIFWLGYFNSCLNPIIYPCYSREFKMAFIRILRCQCHRRKRPYNYRSSNFRSSANSRKSSAEQNSGGLNGSQRTLPSSASPSPSYLTQPLPSCGERDGLYVWSGGGSEGGVSPTTPNLPPGQVRSAKGEAGGGGQAQEGTPRGVFSFFFGHNGGRETADGRGVGPEDTG
ncbi:hypothetical protein NHX12_011915 [Muraenolepis orangiensis]|uniref:G-protein coupled receptors family 1 profile domain-containing protein n=1 Tax=Muraenolepis orangiensis TaxID=630683 RepID=A0A9Q0DHE6_9TELE|nr:hypothetical protein NHX12_011915 [Muraenolepis orangiensis]